MKTIFRGNKINLRKIKRKDANSIFKNAKDREISRFTNLPYPYKIEDAKSFVKSNHNKFRKKDTYGFGIEDQDSKEIIGMISLMKIDWDNKNAEIGYWLGKSYWKKGIATEAVNLILKFGFKEISLKRIYAKVLHPNVSSQKLLENCGFKFEGRMRKTEYREKKWMDDICYAILKEEYKP